MREEVDHTFIFVGDLSLSNQSVSDETEHHTSCVQVKQGFSHGKPLYLSKPFHSFHY